MPDSYITFAQPLNEYILLIVLTLAVLFFTGIRLGVTRGGWNRNLVYLWSLSIYSIYLLFTPLYFYLNGRSEIIGTDITGYYGVGFFFNTLAIFSFILGYWLRGTGNKMPKWDLPEVNEIRNPHKIISVLFYGCYIIVLGNLAIGGANIQQVFVGNEVLGLGARGGSYFLQNFTDSLICIIVLAFIYGIPSRKLLIWIGMAFFLFSLLGFRYRILLSLFGILFVYLYSHELTPKRLIAGATLALIFFYAIMFSTENRFTLITRDYEKIKVDPLTFEYERFFDQTRGALADMAVYRLYDNPNRDAQYDYGITMFGYVFIRMIPRSIYPDKDRFYPPPQLATTIQAYDAWWGKFSGEATLSVAAFYIAFGWIGVSVGHFVWGLLLRRLRDVIRRADKLQFATYIVVALVSFQWITRGYLPQIIDQAVYMLIPIWVMRYYAKKNRNATNKPG